jgi:DNA-binding transcriptional LysR family regulator
MTYDQLLAFVAVAAEGSFTAASAKLHKSQPAVSKLIRNLEDELGIELFDRQEYRATLTEVGRLFHERAVAVLESTVALESFGLALGGKVEPIVRLAVEAVTPLGPIIESLRAVRQRYPAVRIELGTESLAGAVDALREERADVAVATRVGTFGGELEAVALCGVRVIPVARFDHPLVSCGVPIPSALLREHPQIVLRDSGTDPAAPSLNVLQSGLRWTVTDVAAKKEVILAGMGWGGLPEHVAAEPLASGELVALTVPEFVVDTLELFVVRRRDRLHGIVAQGLWEELQRHARFVAFSVSN